MDAWTACIFELRDIGDALLNLDTEERRLHKRYKELNNMPNDPADYIHQGIMIGLDRAWRAYHAVREKYHNGGNAE